MQLQKYPRSYLLFGMRGSLELSPQQLTEESFYSAIQETSIGQETWQAGGENEKKPTHNDMFLSK